ncbi:neuroblast differentiation-associated protein AHNAK-like [Osmerus eperlanus]|uniref:neuroblast differentiation-associated protein AHNAK-like n=1 Tax=Osmerus eperlanus TaxID=29151 RepID=UPI002E118CE0
MDLEFSHHSALQKYTKTMFQSGHRRGRSLCEELTLEETEKGVLVVSGINDSSANQRLQKGDEIVGATIHFDELSKADVLKLLKLIEPFDENVELLSKKTKRPSKSLGALDRCVKAPEEMLKDSYNRLYHDKIKKFIKDNMCVGAGEGSINREFKPRLKDNIESSIQGMDTNTTRVDAPNFIHSPVIVNDPRGENLLHVERPDIDIKTYVNPPNIDTPSTDLKMPGLEQTHISNGLDVSLPKADLTVPVLDLTAQKDKIQDKSCYPEESTITFTALDIYSPKLDTEGTAKKLKIPNLKMQDFGLSGQNIKRPGCKVMTSDLSLPRVDDLTKSKLDLNAPYVSMQTPKRVQSYKKNPDLNVDDPSGYLEVSKVRLSAREPKGIDNDTVFKIPDIDIKSPLIDIHDPRLLNADLPSVDAIRLQTPDITSGIFGIQSNKKPQMDLISPDVLHDGPFELDLSGTLLKRSDLDIDVNTLTPKAPQIKDGIYLSNTSLTKVDTKVSKLDMNTPDVDLNYPSGNCIKMPNIKVPKCGLSKPQEQNNVRNLAEPTITLSPKVEKEMSSPNFDISTVDLTCPDIDDSPSGKFKILDSFKMSDISLFGPKVTGPDCEFIPDCDLSAPQQKGEINRLDLNASDYLKGTEIDLTAPDLNINMPSISFPTFNKPDSKLSDSGIKANTPSSKFRMPKLFGTLSKKTPELSLKAPTMKSGIDVPDLPKANLKELDLGTNTSNIDTDPLKGTLNIPKLRMPNFELPGQRRPRNVDITGHDVRPNLTKGLHIDTYGGIGSSNADTKTPRVNLKGPKMGLQLPDVDLGSPLSKLQKPDLKIDIGVKTPDLSLKEPYLKGGIDVSDLDLPNMDVKAPQLDLNTPNVDIGSPQTKFKIPKLKIPKYGISGLKGPSVDIDGALNAPAFNIPDLHLSDPKLKGRINPPDLKLPTANLKGPKLDVNAPNMNLKMPSGKLNVPTLKKPKAELRALDFDVDPPSGKLKMASFGFSGKQPKIANMDIDTGLKTPNLSLKAPHMKGGIDVSDLDLPNMDVKAPQLDLNTPNVDIGSPQTKFKIPKLKIPKFGISGLKGPSVDIDGALNAPAFNIPDLHLSDPKLKGRINPPDLKLPTANLKGPKLDVNAPNMNLKMPSGKLNVPTLKPKAELSALDFDVDPPSGKLKMPSFGFSGKEPKRPNMDIDTGLKTPHLSLKDTHMKGGIDVSDLDLPNIDVKAPQLDLNTPNVDIDSPQTKFKMPKLKMPKFVISGLKGPSVDIDGALNAPAFNIPDLHLSDPKLKGRINPPDLKLPPANLKGPKLDVNAPNMNLKMPSGKLNVPTLKKPKVELSALDFDVDPPSGKLKMASFGFSGKQPKRANMDIDTGLKTPNLSLKAPHMKGGIDVSDLDLPNIDVKAPQLDLNTPNVDIGSPQTKFKIPKLKMPKFWISGLKGPSVDIDGALNAPAFNIPDLHLSDPKLKGRINPPDLKLPTANLKGPKLDVNDPNMNLKMPSGKLNVPTLKKPKAELSALDFDVDPPSGKLKISSFGFSGKQPKRANMDIDTGLKTPNLSLKAPHMKGDIDVPDLDLPNINVKAPQLDLNTPNVDIGTPQTKFKTPKLKMPKFGISDRKGPSVDIDGALNAPAFDMPDIHLSDPKLKGRINHPDLKLPTANLNGPKLDVNAPNMNFRGLDLTRAGSDIDFGTVMTSRSPDMNISLPKAKLHVKDIKDNLARTKLSPPRNSTSFVDNGVDLRLANLNAASNPKMYVPKSYEKELVNLNLGNNVDSQGRESHKEAAVNEIDQTKMRRTKMQGPQKSEYEKCMLNFTNDNKSPEDFEGYYVTVPKQLKSNVRGQTGVAGSKESNQRSHTHGGLDFTASSLDLEVPEQNDLKGSTFWFSKLI